MTTLRQTAPSGTPDPYIATYAASARHMARQMLDWQLDRLRLELGMVEVVPRDENDGPRRTLRHTRRLLPQENRDRNIRFLPFFDGTGVLIRDKEVSR